MSADLGIWLLRPLWSITLSHIVVTRSYSGTGTTGLHGQSPVTTGKQCAKFTNGIGMDELRATRTRQCPTCNLEFGYPVGKGNDRKHCSAACRVAHQRSLRLARTYPPCPTPGCERQAKRVAAGLCDTCYCRLRRTGTTAPPVRSFRYRRADGYISLVRPGHPLADRDGRVSEHRLVVYEWQLEHDLPLECFWCGKLLTWEDATVDHLNEIKDDNRIENLALACDPCNRARGQVLPFIRRLLPGRIRTLTDWLMLYRARWHNDPGLDMAKRRA
jgi:5-methylcytosine-specific restriction endonuclease McrA